MGGDGNSAERTLPPLRLKRKQSDMPARAAEESPWLGYFCLMVLAFAVNHGCVIAVLSITAAEFDRTLAAASNGMLYGMFGVSALIVAVPAVKIGGAKKVLVVAAGLFCAYALAFGIIALFGHQLEKYLQFSICLVGSCVGGLGAGCLWTAQGAYFGKASELHAKATGQKVEDVNGFFSGVFTTIYLGMEVFLKLFSSVVQNAGLKREFVFSFYATAAILAAFAMCFIKELPREAAAAPNEPLLKLATKKLRDIKVVASDPKVWLIGPLNLSFGWGASYMISYLNGTLAKEALGAKNVGVLTAIPAAYAALVGVPYAWMAKSLGKSFFMNSAGISMFIIGILGLMFPDQLVQGGWGAFIFTQLLLGNVRCVGDSTNRSVFADFFPDTQAGAFAVNILYSSVSNTGGFLSFTLGLDPKIQGSILVMLAGLSFFTTPLAFYLHEKGKEREDREKLLPAIPEERVVHDV